LLWGVTAIVREASMRRRGSIAAAHRTFRNWLVVLARLGRIAEDNDNNCSARAWPIFVAGSHGN
jgi:hypothetical protein